MGRAQRLTAQRAPECALQAMVQRRELAWADGKRATPAVKVLPSLHKHGAGLTVFVTHPEIPMDNNTAHADNGMSRVMPIPGLCRFRVAYSPPFGRIPASRHAHCRHNPYDFFRLALMPAKEKSNDNEQHMQRWRVPWATRISY